MEAQSFFNLCNSIVASGSDIKPIAKAVDSFLDFEDDFIDDFAVNVIEENTTQKLSNTGIKKVTSAFIPEILSADNSVLGNYFYHYLESDRRNIVYNDYAATWNSNFNTKANTAETALCAFAKLLFNLTLESFTLSELKSLRVEDLHKIECAPCVVTPQNIGKLLQLEEDGYDVFETVTLAKYGIKLALELIQTSNYDFVEATQYLSNQCCFQAYCRLKITNTFNKESFDTLLSSVSVGGMSTEELLTMYNDSNEELISLVAQHPKDVINAIYQSPSGAITYEWLERYRNTKNLLTLINARVDGCYLSWFEEKADNLPDWCVQMYADGKLSGAQEDTVWLDLILKEVNSNFLNTTGLLSNEAAFALLNARKTGVINAGELRKYALLYQFVECHSTTIKPFNKFVFDRLFQFIGEDTFVPVFVDTACLIVDEKGRVLLTDSFSVAANYEHYTNKLIAGQFSAKILNNNAGIILYNVKQSACIDKLMTYHYTAKSSIELWAQQGDPPKGVIEYCDDVRKLNLALLIGSIPKDTVVQELMSFLEKNITQYEVYDRCFDFIRNQAPYVIPAINGAHCIRTLKAIMPHMLTKNKYHLTFEFLKSILHSTGKLVGNPKRSEIELNRISIELLNGSNKEMTIDTMFKQFEDIIRLLEQATKIQLLVKNGIICLKLDK